MAPLRVALATDPRVLDPRVLGPRVSDPRVSDPRVSDPFRGEACGAVDVLLLPELMDGGYAALAQGAAPHRAGDRLLTACREASRRLALCLIAGSVCYARPTGGPTNTSIVFSRGRRIHSYDKIHLFRPTGDHRYFARGASWRTFAVNHGRRRLRMGIVICYDLRFPELIRALALEGMQVLFVPARWPRARDEAWKALLKARAIENQIFVVGCNAAGPEGGRSYAFDPLGRTVRMVRRPGPGGTSCATVALDLALLTRARTLHTNLDEAVLLRQSRIPRALGKAGGARKVSRVSGRPGRRQPGDRAARRHRSSAG